MFHLQEAGIASAHLGGTVSWDEQRATLDLLRARPPGIKVLFLTPEKLAASDSLLRVLDDLNGDRVLVRPGSRLPMHLGCWQCACAAASWWPGSMADGDAVIKRQGNGT